MKSKTLLILKPLKLLAFAFLFITSSLVAQIELPDTLLQWGASASNEQQINSICSEMVHSLSIHNPRYFEKATIVIYLWNPNKLNFEFKDMEITRRKGNPLVFGLFQEIR